MRVCGAPLFILLTELLFVFSSAEFLAGGAGHCLTFQSWKNYAVFPNVTNLDTDEFTVEFWMRLRSPTTKFTPFSYAIPEVFDDQRLTWNGGGEIFIMGGQLSFNDRPLEDLSNWHHYAMIWTQAEGEDQAQFWRDGEKWVSSVTIPVDNGLALENGGTIVLGQEQDLVGGAFDQSVSFEGQIEELRIWRVRRTAEELQETMHRMLSTGEVEDPSLVSYYTFEPVSEDPYMVVDSKGVNHGSLAEWTGCHIPASTCGLPCYLIGNQTMGNIPLYGKSSAPLLGFSTPSIYFVDPLSSIPIQLKSSNYSASQLNVVQFPVMGSIFQATATLQRGQEINDSSAVISNEEGFILYESHGNFTDDVIVYQVNFEALGEPLTGTIVLQLNDPPVALDIAYSASEDIPLDVPLVASDSNGDLVHCSIESLPENGILWERDANREPLSQITEPSVVQDYASTVIFIPSPHWNGVTSFQYTCIDQGDNTSNISTVTITVSPVDDFAVVGGPLFGLDFTGASTYLEALIVEEISVGTIDVWLKVDNSSIDAQIVLAVPEHSFSIVREDSILRVQAGSDVLEANGLPTQGSWVHLAVTLNGTSSAIYFNGNETSRGSLPQELQLSAGSSFTVGSNSDDSYTGDMDELRMWSTALSMELIQASIQTKYTTGTDGLSLGYTFDEGKGSTVNDISENGNHATLGGSPPDLFSQPQWTLSSVPSYDTVYLQEDSFPHFTIPFRELEDQLAVMVITKLPMSGTLYNVAADGSYIPMLEPYVSWNSLAPVSQWVDEVTDYSSFWGSGPSYSADQVIGEPNTEGWNPLNPLHGDSANSWSPQTQESGNGEWIEVRYESPVYVQNVNAYQNYNPGSIYGISGLQDNQWVPLWKGNPQTGLPQKYTIHEPTLCQQVFSTDKIRLEMDTSVIFGWNEIDAILMIGTQELKPGVVSNPAFQVAYRPNKDLFGDTIDSIEYKVIDCAYDPKRESLASTLKFTILPVNDAPVSVLFEPSEEGTLSFTENVERVIQLGGTDSDNDTLVIVIQSLPESGQLYQVTEEGNRGDSISSPNTPVSSSEGKIIYLPANGECGIALSTFTFLVRDQTLSSGAISVTTDVYCIPGKHFISDAVYATVGVCVGICMLACIGFLVWVIVKWKNSRSLKASSPAFLAIFLVGSILCLVVLFMWMMPLNTVLCHLNIWILSLGFILLYGSLFAKTYRIWRIFQEYFEDSDTIPKNGVPVDVTERFLLGVLGIFTLIDTILLVIFSTVDPPSMVQSVDESNPARTKQTCDYNPLTLAALVFFPGILVIIGLFLSIATRKIDEIYDESKYIAINLYIIAFFSLIAIPLLALQDDVFGEFLSFSLCVMITVLATVLVLFVPKIYMIITGGTHAFFWKKRSPSTSVHMSERSTAKQSESEMVESHTVDS